jgi:hypothetical protein
LENLEENLREFQLKLKKQWRDLEGFGADESILEDFELKKRFWRDLEDFGDICRTLFWAEAGEETINNNAQICVAAGEFGGVRNFEVYKQWRNACCWCKIGKDFEPKNNGKYLLQQLWIGKDFWAEEEWKRFIAAAANWQGFSSWRNKGESYPCRCESARILSRRIMEKIYCSSWESVRVFELKKQRRKLILPVCFGKDFEPKNNGKRTIAAAVNRQGFWIWETMESCF